MRQNWPERLWLVRHGQSQGNVARDAADEAGAHEIDIDLRDVDVPLSDSGRKQAEAAGRWFAALPRDERPEMILSSPYVRAKQTAEIICQQGALAGGPARTIVDERLREREFGIFDRLTTAGIRAALPRGSRAPPPPRQILPSAARRRELGRRDPAPALDAQHDQPPLLRPARAGRLPPGRRAVLPLHPRGARRGADPRHRQAGRGAQLRHRRLSSSSPMRRASASRSWRCGTTARRSRPRARPKTSAPDAMAGTR